MQQHKYFLFNTIIKDQGSFVRWGLTLTYSFIYLFLVDERREDDDDDPTLNAGCVAL